MGLAYAAPPEIAASVFLRLVASGKIADREAKIQLIEEAFSLAANAHDRFRLAQIKGVSPDSRSGAIARAARLKLDTLSLRAAAVRAMLELDPAKARELFSRMDPPDPPARSCDDALVFDLTDFYSLLTDLASRTFTSEERRLEQHIGFVRLYVMGITSPVQVVPVARMVRTLNVTPNQRDLLVATFAAALQNVATENRSFLVTAESVANEVAPLATDTLQIAFDKYMERQRGAEQCQGAGMTIDIGAGVAATPPPAAKIHPYWTSGEAQAMLARGLQLRWGPTGIPGRMVTIEERKAVEWQTQLADTLKAMESWKPASGETETDYFHQRCLFYESLVELTPPGATRDNLIAAFLNFLSHSTLLRECAAEWLSHGVDLLTRLRLSGDPDAGRLRDAFIASDNPALALAARLDGDTIPGWRRSE